MLSRLLLFPFCRPDRPDWGCAFTATLEFPKLARLREVSPEKWATFRGGLSGDQRLLSDVGLASCPKGCSLVSVSKREVSTLSEVPSVFSGERRNWISVRMPPESNRKLSPESREILSMWASCMSFDSPTFPLALAPLLPCEAFADACADAHKAGIGGFVTVPWGLTASFRAVFTPSDLREGGVLFRFRFAFCFLVLFLGGPHVLLFTQDAGCMCRPAVVPCTIFDALISGSAGPFSAQDAGCICLLLWCGVHCSLTSVICTCWCCCCCSRPDGCMCRPAVPCTIFADLISGPCVLFSAQVAGCVCLLLWCGAHCSLTSVI